LCKIRFSITLVFMTVPTESKKPKRQPKHQKGTGTQLLEVLNRLAVKVPDKAWDSVPNDGSKRVNEAQGDN
jgi:hypothetical protein